MTRKFTLTVFAEDDSKGETFEFVSAEERARHALRWHDALPEAVGISGFGRTGYDLADAELLVQLMQARRADVGAGAFCYAFGERDVLEYTVLGLYTDNGQTYIDLIEWSDHLKDMAGVAEEAHRRCNESNNPFDRKTEPEDYATYTADLQILFIVEGDICGRIAADPFQSEASWNMDARPPRPMTDVELIKRYQ